MIEVALTGRLAKPPKLGKTKGGKAMATCTLAVTPDGATKGTPPTWVRILAFEDHAAELEGAEPGARVYAEGRLEASIWRPESGGEPRLNLTVLARRVFVMGRIGKRRPAARRARGEPQDGRAGPSRYRMPGRAIAAPGPPSRPLRRARQAPSRRLSTTRSTSDGRP